MSQIAEGTNRFLHIGLSSSTLFLHFCDLSLEGLARFLDAGMDALKRMRVLTRIADEL